MINLLLLFLSLMTGCEAKSEVRGCTEGWFEFTCKYPGTSRTYNIYLVSPKGTEIKSTKKDVWEDKESVSLYHDTKKKALRVAVKQVISWNFWGYQCIFYGQKPFPVKPEPVFDNGCQEQFIQTAYRRAKTTITCDRGNKDDFMVNLFCKQNGSICDNILSTKYPNVTRNITSSGVNMSISNVSSQHAGVYWCGMKSTKGSYRASLRKIQLEVKDITSFKRSPTIGDNLKYWCGYGNSNANKTFICKGEDPSMCKLLVKSTLSMKNKKFVLEDKTKEKKLYITMVNVTPSDAGIYWCGEESTDKRNKQFLHRMEMTVVSPKSPSQNHGKGLPVIIAVVIIVSVLLLLLFALFLILIYKRHSKTQRNAAAAAAAAAAARHIKEEYIYEEIQELPQRPDSENTISTVYVTANFPTNPSASPYYSTVRFQNSSGEAGEALIYKPCEYSTVKDHQSPTDSTAHQPSSEEPLYSTVYNPQEEE